LNPKEGKFFDVVGIPNSRHIPSENIDPKADVGRNFVRLFHIVEGVQDTFEISEQKLSVSVTGDNLTLIEKNFEIKRKDNGDYIFVEV